MGYGLYTVHVPRTTLESSMNSQQRSRPPDSNTPRADRTNEPPPHNAVPHVVALPPCVSAAAFLPPDTPAPRSTRSTAHRRISRTCYRHPVARHEQCHSELPEVASDHSVSSLRRHTHRVRQQLRADMLQCCRDLYVVGTITGLGTRGRSPERRSVPTRTRARQQS